MKDGGGSKDICIFSLFYRNKTSKKAMNKANCNCFSPYTVFVISRFGFGLMRQRGSLLIYKKGIRLVVPVL